jgi:hypothetical protein
MRRVKLEILSREDMEKIHQESLRILSEKGMRYLAREGLEILADFGAEVDFDSQIAKLPPDLVEDSLKKTPSSFKIAILSSLLATTLVTFFKITFPLIRPGVISGALFAFITSFDEVVISYFLSTYRSITLPKHMWSALREQIDPTIAASSTLLILTAVCLLITVSVLMKRAERLRA